MQRRRSQTKPKRSGDVSRVDQADKLMASKNYEYFNRVRRSLKKFTWPFQPSLQECNGWRRWKMKNVIVVATLVAIIYFLIFCDLHDEVKRARSFGITARIIEWTPNGETEGNDSNRRIFFHETSGRNDLNLRQTCTIESAAKHNPDRPIQVFMTTNRLDYNKPWLKSVLQNYNNVAIILVNPGDYFANTELEKWYLEGEWKSSLYSIVHLSDYMRVLTIQKGGGMYMDLDFVTLKPLDQKLLWNFFLIESEEMKLLTNAVLHLERGHRLIPHMIERLVKYYYADEYFWHGPSLVSNIMNKHCGVKRGAPDSNNCTDTNLMPHYYFAPISTSGWQLLFNETTPRSLELIQDSYGVHCWSGKSKNEPLDLSSNKLYARLARENCPITVSKAAEFCDDVKVCV